MTTFNPLWVSKIGRLKKLYDDLVVYRICGCNTKIQRFLNTPSIKMERSGW